MHLEVVSKSSLIEVTVKVNAGVLSTGVLNITNHHKPGEDHGKRVHPPYIGLIPKVIPLRVFLDHGT